MDLRQLRYFLTIAETTSLTTAAKSLLVTQPTLTMSMKKLEADLGVTLFRPGERGHHLTEAGRALYEEGSELLRRFDQLEARMQSWGAARPEQLRVGLTVLFSMQLMRRISAFMSAHQHVEVTLVQGGSRDMQRRLVAGEVDLGILSFPQYEAEMSLQPLAGISSGYDVAVVMRADHPLAERETVGFAELRDQQWSSLSSNFVLGTILPKRAQAAGYCPEVVFTNDDWEVLLASVENLDTVCLLPADFEDMSRHDGLAWLPLEDRANHFPVGIATRRGVPLSPVAEEFLQVLRRP